MLEQLHQTKTLSEERFRENLICMITAMRTTQVLIKAFQDNGVIQGSKELKPLKRFSQEVFQKLEWFYTVLQKMAGENAAFMRTELDLDGDKVNNSASLVVFVAMSFKEIDDEVELLTSLGRRKTLFQKCWMEAKGDQTGFEAWYDQLSFNQKPITSL